MCRTNIQIKGNHGYYYSWVTFLLHTTVSRPCQLVLELRVYRNVDFYSPPTPRPRILRHLSASLRWIFAVHQSEAELTAQTEPVSVIVLCRHLIKRLMEMGIPRPRTTVKLTPRLWCSLRFDNNWVRGWKRNRRWHLCSFWIYGITHADKLLTHKAIWFYYQEIY